MILVHIDLLKGEGGQELRTVGIGVSELGRQRLTLALRKGLDESQSL